MAIKLKRAVPGRLIGGRFYPNPKGSGTEDALYRVFRKRGYSRREARRLAKLNAPYFVSNPADRWVEAKGSPIKKIRFRSDGYADVIVEAPTPMRRKNESYRKVKKQARKAQRAGLLEPGPMFQKFRKAAKISKKGRKRNPGGRWRVKKIKDFYGKTAYLVTKGPSHTFGKFSKKEDAQKRADELNYGGSRSNPLVSTPTTFHHRLGKYQLLPKRVHSDGTVDFLYAEGGIGQDFSVGPQGGIIGRLPPFAHGNAKKLARIAREQDR